MLVISNIAYGCSVSSIKTFNMDGDVVNVLGTRTVDFEFGYTAKVRKGS